MSKPERSLTLIVTPQLLPKILQLSKSRQESPKAVHYVLCENLACTRSRTPFPQSEEVCQDCGSSFLCMDDQQALEVLPWQTIGKVEAYYFWEPVKKIYRHRCSLQLEDYNPTEHGTYIRYLPAKTAVSQKRMEEFLYSVNYQRTADPYLELGLVPTIQHVIDLSDPIEDLQVSLADLEASWEASPLCPK